MGTLDTQILANYIFVFYSYQPLVIGMPMLLLKGNSNLTFTETIQPVTMQQTQT